MSEAAAPKPSNKAGRAKRRSTKGKRRTTVGKDIVEMLVEESDAHSELSRDEQASATSEVVSKASETAACPKVVEVHLPGPSPKRSARHSEECSVLSRSACESVHAQSSPRLSRQGTPSVRMKPSSPIVSSITKPASTGAQPGSPVDDVDDTESLAESSHGSRIRRSEPERVQYFKEQPDCGELEAHRAFCTRCDSWVYLGKRQSYTVRPWEKHRVKCDLKTPIKKEPPTEALGAEDTIKDEIDHREQDVASASPIASNAIRRDSSSPATSWTSNREQERLAILQSDPHAQEIKPSEIFCRSCREWVKLSTTEAYSLSDWQLHRQHCSGSPYVPGPIRPAASKQNFSPGSRVATAERKIALLNDPQVRTASPSSVMCTYCKAKVALESDLEYDLTRWNEHKTMCTPMSPAAARMPVKRPLSRLSHIFPPPTPGNIITPSPMSRTLRGVTSSTDVTLVADEPATQVGMKRGREEETDACDGDRPVNRLRMEDYRPADQEAPGPWGWFMQPLKAFIRGFREGLGTPT